MSTTNKVSAFPAKAFFVRMLTRDIELEDAIMDLIDNCVDGVLRVMWTSGVPLEVEKPYEGFYANITLDKTHFIIEDNCGGIPWEVAEEYAFRMGRPNFSDDNIPTVGVYGVGMKRAIFKMGKHGEVLSKTDKECYKVTISPQWLEEDSEWELPVEVTTSADIKDSGTVIKVSDLYEPIARWFDNAANVNSFIERIQHHYSIIILKGFRIFVNGSEVKPIDTTLLIDSSDFDSDRLAPYIYKANFDGVDVFLAVGFYRDRPEAEEVEAENRSRRSKENAGWTIVCNDRVVVHKDKTILTGWGESGVPQYHSQFIAISGTVFFRSNRADKLPVKTTKRGIDGNSELYLKVKNQMRTGMKIFANYTNQWKQDRSEEIKVSASATQEDVLKIERVIPEDKWRPLPNSEHEEKVFKPRLPRPEKKNPKRHIQFSRPESEVRAVSYFLFGNEEETAAKVGDGCFSKVLTQIR